MNRLEFIEYRIFEVKKYILTRIMTSEIIYPMDNTGNGGFPNSQDYNKK